jgi:alpha-N-arabinofuranosidase
VPMDTPLPTSRPHRTLALLVLVGCTLRTAPAALAAPTIAAVPVQAVVEASRTSAPIQPNLYGMFIEHAGSLVYRGMWAELIDDRKFWSAVTVETAAAPPAPRGPFGAPPRRWSPIGPIEFVAMDTQHAYVGDHSLAIALDPGEPRGIAQKGLALLRDKAYTGRIVLAGDPEARVTITLVWGSGAADRETLTIGKLTATYATFPLAFKCPVDSDDGRIEIKATGTGKLRIGAVSLMPADNVEGWRREVVEVLKSLRSGAYRWPGGNFVSAHDWRDAIGAPDQRPPVWDPVWNALQSNDVGTDEFMALCRLTSVEPYITVNSGFGDARSAAEYVEYANAPATTPWGARRVANGHPEPYRVKYWNIGNEMWGSWQYGYMPLAQYVVKHNLFAEAMRKVDPSIVLIASGAMPDTMTGSRESLKLGDKLVPEYLGPADWTGALFQKCLDNMDMISEHFYNYDSHFDLAQAKQVPNDKDEPLVDWMRRPANHIRLKYEEYQEYLARIPALKQKPVPIALDEYAYTFGGSYKVVPAYAWTFHEMFRHADLYQLATLTFITSTYSAAHGQAVLNPTGMLFKFYRDRFGTIPVEVMGTSPQPKPKDPPGGEQPAVHAGSDTFPLDVAAAWTPDRKALTIAVINPTDTAQTLRLQIRGAALSGKGILRRMAPQSLTATLVVGQEPGVKIEEQPVAAFPGTATFAPFSVSIYELPVKQPGRTSGLRPHHPDATEGDGR